MKPIVYPNLAPPLRLTSGMLGDRKQRAFFFQETAVDVIRRREFVVMYNNARRFSK